MPASPDLSSLVQPVRLNRYIPHIPWPKQHAFLNLTCEEALFGGAASGGKSDVLLMGALQYADVPGYGGILLRRTRGELSQAGGLIPRSMQWLRNTDAEYNVRENMWRFPHGATLQFGYCEHPGDVYQYQGGEYQYIGWDELTAHPEEDYGLLTTRLRATTDMHVPLRIRAATNPGGKYEEWVERYFLTEGKKANPPRAFFPANVWDNPSVGKDYAERLARNPDEIRVRQLLHGEWGISAAGTKFSREWFNGYILDRLPTGAGNMNFVRYWDLAGAEPSVQTKDPDFTAGVLIGEYRPSKDVLPWDDGRSQVGIYYICDVRNVREKPATRDHIIRSTAASDPPGTRQVVERIPGNGKEVTERIVRDVLRGYPSYIDSAVGDKEFRADALSAAAQARNVRIVKGGWRGVSSGDWVEPFLRQLCSFPYAAHDDMVDGAGGALRFLTKNQGYHRQPLTIVTRDEITRRNLDRRPWRVA